jgi:hypothetical protein
MDQRIERFLRKFEGKTVREVIIPDLHAPHTVPSVFEEILRKISEHKPHVVRQVGDWRELSAMSTYDSDDTHPQDFENAEVAEQSIQIRKASGNAELYIHHEGNHGARGGRLNARLRSLLKWENDSTLGPEWNHWVHFPYYNSKRGLCKLGQVISYHGFKVSRSSDSLEGLRMCNLAGWEGGEMLTVRGHTHRAIPPTQSNRTISLKLPHWYANVGTAGPLEPEFAARFDSDWSHAILLVEHKIRSSYTAREWQAELHEITE